MFGLYRILFYSRFGLDEFHCIWQNVYHNINLVKIRFPHLLQGSPHIVKTGRLDFSLSWLKGEVRENLGDFRKSIQILTFLSPLLHVPLPLKYDYWWKKYGREKTDRVTKTSLFDRNWAISLKPRRRSCPFRLVWWALFIIFYRLFTNHCVGDLKTFR